GGARGLEQGPQQGVHGGGVPFDDCPPRRPVLVLDEQPRLDLLEKLACLLTPIAVRQHQLRRTCGQRPFASAQGRPFGGALVSPVRRVVRAYGHRFSATRVFSTKRRMPRKRPSLTAS